MPLLSIIVPVYNGEQYIRQCVDSILSQTFRDYELIIVDDGSTDDSGIICDEYAEKDSRVVVLHTSNQGQAAARNKALDIERGDYIAFIDADDYVHPALLELAVVAIKKYHVEIVNFGYEEGPLRDYTWNSAEPEYRIESSRQYCRMCILNNAKGVWILCDKVFNKKCFEGIRLPEGRIYEDNATVYKIMFQSDKIAVTDKVLYYYYQHEGSTTNQSFSEKSLDWLTVLDEMSSFFLEKNDEEIANCIVKRYLRRAVDYYIKLIDNYPESRNILEIKERVSHYFKLNKPKLRKDLKLSFALYCMLYLHPKIVLKMWALKKTIEKIHHNI